MVAKNLKTAATTTSSSESSAETSTSTKASNSTEKSTDKSAEKYWCGITGWELHVSLYVDEVVNQVVDDFIPQDGEFLRFGWGFAYTVFVQAL